MPSISAKFAGTHTMELDTTDRIYGLKCTPCHKYISDEMGATNLSTSVSNAHRTAAENANYVGLNKEINISAEELPVFDGGHVNTCLLCHLAEVNVVGTHTKVVVRACTDVDCHGNSTDQGSSIYPSAGLVGMNLSNINDSHHDWFKQLDQISSKHADEEGGNYTCAFYACLGCHTYTGMRFSITRPTTINMSMDLTDGLTISEATMNNTNFSTIITTRGHGSVWS